MVYAVESGGVVKIGTAFDAAARLVDLQLMNAARLTVLRVMKGTRSDEQRLHRLLVVHRRHGEWFTDNDDVRLVLGYLPLLAYETRFAQRVVSQAYERRTMAGIICGS